MKTGRLPIIALSIMLFTTLSCADALASMLVYSPEAASLSIPAGAQDTLAVSIDVIDTTATMYMLWPAFAMEDGNLPVEWISPSGTGYSAFLTPGMPKNAVFTISVPQDTPSGVYSGRLLSRAQASHGLAESGTGVLVSVAIPPDCSGIGAFTIDQFGPTVLWPPDHGMKEVVVRGVVTIPAGCSLLEAGYAIDDEYGVFTSVGTLTINAGGGFTLPLPLEAWRTGQDKDGRHYAVSLYVTDEAGVGSTGPLMVTVPHDMSIRHDDDHEQDHHDARDRDHDSGSPKH